MQILVKSIIALFILTFISCDRDDFQPDYSNGQATALMNEETWKGQTRGVVIEEGKSADLIFSVFDEVGQLRQVLGFSKVSYEPDLYPLYNTSGQSTDSLAGCSFVTLSFDGDVVEDRYRVVETGEQSTIKVTDYKNSNRLLCGEFSLKLYIDPDRPKSNPSNPDTILFEMGEFEVRIEE